MQSVKEIVAAAGGVDNFINRAVEWERQLEELRQEGYPVVVRGNRVAFRIGKLLIYTTSGRFFSEETRRRGKIGNVSMRDLMLREIPHGAAIALRKLRRRR